MKSASAIAVQPSASDALEESVRKVRELLGDGLEPDLVLLFVSPFYHHESAAIAQIVAGHFPGATVFGCSGAGVIGAAQEVEGEPALSLTVGHLPGVQLTPFHLGPGELPSPDAHPDAWRQLVGVPQDLSPQFLLLMEPFSTPGDQVLEGLDYAYPGSVKIGGLASGGSRPGTHALFLNGDVHLEGVVGVALQGNVVVDTVVAQGCRPVGQPMRITGAEGNILLAVDGEPP